MAKAKSSSGGARRKSRRKRPKSKTLRVRGYGRYSTTHQHGSDISQRDELEDWLVDSRGLFETYANAKGVPMPAGTLEIESWYADEAKSGNSDDSLRPDFGRLHEDALAGEFDVLVVHQRSRYSRLDQFDIGKWGNKLKRAGVALAVLQDEKVYDFAIAKDRGDFADAQRAEHYQLRTIGIASVKQKRKKFKQGLEQGKPPFGYQRKYTYRDGSERIVPYGEKYHERDKDAILTFVRCPKHGDTAERVFKLFLEGHGRTAIAKTLNEEGWQTASGKPWRASHIQVMTRNAEKYAGSLVAGKTKCGRYATVCGEQSESLDEVNAPLVVSPTDSGPKVVRDYHEAIITREQCDKVLTRLAASKRGKRPAYSGSDALLTGLAVCDFCGTKMRKVSSNYYRCGLARDSGGSACSAMKINQRKLEAAVISACRVFLGCACDHEGVIRPMDDEAYEFYRHKLGWGQVDPMSLEAATFNPSRNYDRKRTKARQALQRKRERLEAAVEKLTGQIKRGSVNLIDLDGDAADALKEKLDELEGKRTEQQAALAGVVDELDATSPERIDEARAEFRAMQDGIVGFGDELTEETFQELRKLLSELVAEVRIGIARVEREGQKKAGSEITAARLLFQHGKHVVLFDTVCWHGVTTHLGGLAFLPEGDPALSPQPAQQSRSRNQKRRP